MGLADHRTHLLNTKSCKSVDKIKKKTRSVTLGSLKQRAHRRYILPSLHRNRMLHDWIHNYHGRSVHKFELVLLGFFFNVIFLAYEKRSGRYYLRLDFGASSLFLGTGRG